MEIWKPVFGYEGLYEASSEGQIRSIDRTVSVFSARAGKVVPLHRKGKVIRQCSAINGYRTVSLSMDGVAKTRRVAGLICGAFHGQPGPGLQVCHNDGCKTNNRADNLRWGTATENQSDRVLHKTDLRGEQIKTAKLVESQVIRIKSGMSFKEAHQEFGVSHAQYYRIRKGTSWAHVA